MNRPCPFCANPQTLPWRRRPEGSFLVCSDCRSYLKDLDWEAFVQLHSTAFEDGSFLDRTASGTEGPLPDLRTWDRFFGHLRPGSVLEVGPGGGQLLAAAMQRGWQVRGIETSPTHRAWIKEHWSYDTHRDLDDLPVDYRPDLIIMINVLEHVFDPEPLLTRLGQRVKPGGKLFLSLPNASSLVPSLAGVWWSMFKQPDHVSIPTRKGLGALIRRSGWAADRIWSTELALETPLGLAVALRDWRRARRGDPPAPSHAAESPDPPSAQAPRSLARRLQRIPPSLDPLAQLSGWFLRAGTLKAWLRHP